LFEHPWAIFPGPDGNIAACFSELDTTYAVFTINFTKRNPQGVVIPEKLQEAVDHSDFEVRASTRKEISFVANYIKTADADQLSALLRGGLTSVQSRAGLLKFLIARTHCCRFP
jgi:hypothetical protein